MLLEMTEVRRLGSLRVPVKGPQGRPRAAELDRVRADALERLVAASGIDGLVLSAADVVLQPAPAGGRLWMGSWLPARCCTELDGGPKDGALVCLPSLRSELEYRQLSPSWALAAAAGFPLPKVSFRYQLAGYDPARCVYVHRYWENLD